MGNYTNELTRMLGITLPIVLAPMAGGPTTPKLIAAVSNAGGLGSMGAAMMPPDDIKEAIRAVKKLTDKPFSVNLFIPENTETTLDAQRKMCDVLNEICQPLGVISEPVEPPYNLSFAEQFEALIESEISIFSCIFGIPEKKYLDEFKQKNIKLIGTATTLDAAKELEQAGFDAIVAQGVEAGGHQGSFPGIVPQKRLSTVSLVKEFSVVVSKPIIAAGGIADKKGLETALNVGAQAAQIGTAFLTTDESGADPKHKEAILNMDHDNTQLTKSFSGRYARAINNQYIKAMEAHQDVVLPFPIQNKLTKLFRAEAGK